jgi:ubiquinone/menaquinone biosynthesis C-methylase UbiE
MIDYNKLIKKYSEGKNISLYLKKNSNLSKEAITKISYDLQSGKTINNFTRSKRRIVSKVMTPMVEEIKKFKNVKTILDFGAGELTNLSFLKKKLKNIKFYANDISFNRLYLGKKFLDKEFRGKNNVILICNNHFKLPFKDNSFDIVTTMQALEPNGSMEKPLLKELYRVCKKGIVSCEPHYEIANQSQKKRMKLHGYVINLEKTIKKLKYKYKIVNQNYSLKKINPTSIFVIMKNSKSSSKPEMTDPATGDILVKKNNFYLNKKSKRIYPIIDTIIYLNENFNLFLPRY